jgi:uncharacterized membrane protein YfcA
MDLSAAELLFIAAASVAAGLVNAVAGGGTLIAFPALTVVGIPTVDANITTTIALTPGYFGGTLAQREDLAGQRRRIVRLVPGVIVGGLAGAALLAVTSENLFRHLVPWLLFAACGLLAGQDRIRAAVSRRAQRRAKAGVKAASDVPIGSVAAVAVAGLYGGYFGAALGIILLAVLGVTIDDDLRRINALKQLLSLVANVAASLLLLFSGKVPWDAAAVMAVGSLVGGVIGGKVARRLDARLFRAIVIAIGVVVGVVYLVKA